MANPLYDYHFEEDSVDVLISLRDVAEEQGLKYEILMARLNAGCPLALALQMPEDWLVHSIIEDDCGDLYFEISKIVSRGYREEIFHSIKF